MTATVFEIKHFAVHDGDGIRTTVFFKGCPLRCVWCHNPEGLTATPQIARYAHKCIGCGECRKETFLPENCLGDAYVVYGREMTLEALLPLLLEDEEFYKTSGGGVTLSGGECLMQADFCAELLKQLKTLGIHTAVDTCGFVPKTAFDKVIPFTDVFLYDIKAYDEDVHKVCTGQSNQRILENLRYLDSLGKAIEIRIPCIPTVNDGEVLERIACRLSGIPGIVGVRPLAYHDFARSKYQSLGKPDTMPHVPRPDAAAMEAIRQTLRAHGLPVLE